MIRVKNMAQKYWINITLYYRVYNKAEIDQTTAQKSRNVTYLVTSLVYLKKLHNL